MAEKRVSVRLAAVGGKQVRAELDGVGDAGVKGFGRMSKEAKIANARLAAFSTRVKIAAAVAVAAAAAAGIAMIRSGLETIDAQANLAQSLGTTTRSIQVLTFAGDLAGVSMDEITAATKKLTLKLSDAAGGTGTAVAALQRLHLTATDLQALPLDERIVAIQDALTKFVLPAERAAVASALFGDKAALAFSRIDSATLRQASQDITDFGVAVSDQDADQIRTAGDAIDRLGLVWLGLTNQLTVAVAPALEAVANALADATRAGGIFQTSKSFLGDHIGEIASIAGAFATFFAGRFIIALGAAALGVSGFSLSLNVLQGALIRTGIGALIVGAGELVYQFSKLVEGAGGFGAALGLLSNLASEVWDRIGLGVDAVVASLHASWSGITATIADAMQGALVAVVGFGNSATGVFQGAFDAMKAIWSALPSAIGDFAFQAANGLISGVEAMLNGVVTRINTFISGLNAALDMLPDWATGEGGIQIGTLDPVTLGRVGNPFEGAATAAGAAAADAFKAAMGKTYLETPDLGLGTMANDARDRAAAYNEAAGMLADAASRPLSSWQALQDAMTKAGTDGAAALDGATTAADGTTDALNAAGTAAGGAGAAGKAAADAAATGWAAVTAALSDYAAKSRDIGGDVGQTLVGAFQSAEDAVASFVKTGKLSFGDLVTSILADLAKLAARKFILGPIASALDGVLGSLGGGGLFGTMVGAAVQHAGGIVGGSAPMRAVPMWAFAGAPRMHSGGFAGLRPDEVPAILQKGERVLSRQETSGYGAGGNVSITIQTRDAESFRQSRTQVASDIARTVSLGRRGM
ncbi:MAG: phage tail tape-measure protein [Cypionkella sp.]|uniref:phage tail tape measure C-terminal domain-containing protein n=1 Tax=Cypionkella sp. TaxID=2811411 RepID=UPI0026224445|nr:phage tail tape measure C-terminal domain-containing protein [Cypionkella sp.]MDB5658089.1 phage tail tape-measure protein [Cypionkella sp.]